MDQLFANLSLADVHQDVFRNIVSIHVSQDLFDDLSPDPHAWQLAQSVETEVKPHPYLSHMPVIYRPFEDAKWLAAIGWPFKHWQASRFSDGSFGVWYGASSVETTVHETAYHWVTGFLKDAGFENEPVVAERKVYSVACAAALLDFRQAVPQFPALVHTSDYRFPQEVGARLHREGHPGLLTCSVRHAGGDNYAILNPAVLANPIHHCQLTYRLQNGVVGVEKQLGVTWLNLECAAFGA